MNAPGIEQFAPLRRARKLLRRGVGGAPGRAAVDETMASAQNGRHALIVEDERLLLDSIEEALGKIPWLRITKAGSAELALEQFDVDPPDVVLTDVRMPGMGGLEFLDRLRARDPDVPVVVMTAYGVHLQGEALRRGATCFLEKPFRMSELRGVLQLLLAKGGNAGAPTPARVSVEPLSLTLTVQAACMTVAPAQSLSDVLDAFTNANDRPASGLLSSREDLRVADDPDEAQDDVRAARSESWRVPRPRP